MFSLASILARFAGLLADAAADMMERSAPERRTWEAQRAALHADSFRRAARHLQGPWQE